MKILNFFKKEERKIIPDKELVSTVGISNFWSLDGVVYNPDVITIETYNKIASHYQVKNALAVISYSIQQMDWFIQTEDEEIKKVVTYSIDKIWNSLIRSISKSFKYGYSPNVKVFTLEIIDGKEYIVYKKIKDLDPQKCKLIVDKYGNYNGFEYNDSSVNGSQTIKPEYSFWYSSNMENGNIYGDSMLKGVYKPWYFSEKIHTFANRYYERFGEPLIEGRAPASSTVIDSTGKATSGQEVMNNVIANVRSHSSVQLPSDRDDKGNYLYDLKYIESQMRGFDFDNYLNRLDIEIYRGMFIPDLMMSSGSGGSYALGSAQIQSFYTTLMGIMANIKDYVNLYIIPQLVQYNFDTNASVKFTSQPLSVDSKKNIQDLIMELVKAGKVELDIDQLVERSGFKMEKVEIEETEKDMSEDVKNEVDKKGEELMKSLRGELLIKSTLENLEKEKKETERIKNQLIESLNE